jgi:hypothetical protein
MRQMFATGTCIALYRYTKNNFQTSSESFDQTVSDFEADIPAALAVDLSTWEPRTNGSGLPCTLIAVNGDRHGALILFKKITRSGSPMRFMRPEIKADGI